PFSEEVVMNALRLPAAFLTVLAVVMLAAAPARAAEKATNKDKIVGTWEVVKSESDVAVGDTIEFTKDGKININAKVDGKAMMFKGTYAVDGDKLTVTIKIDDNNEHKETMTIKTLTDKSLVTVDDKKKTDEFKKK